MLAESVTQISKKSKQKRRKKTIEKGKKKQGRNSFLLF